MKISRLILLGLFIATLQGCISAQSDPLPRTETIGEIEAIARDFDFDFAYRHDHGGEAHEHDDDDAGGNNFGFVVEKTLKRIGAIDNRALNQGLLKIKLIQEDDYSVILSFLSTITLFVLPSYSHDDLTVVATYEEGDKVLHRVEVSSSVNTFYQFFFLFAMPFTDGYKLERNARYLTEEACFRMLKKMGLKTLRKEE
ncbi:MAG: hypothetical protein P1V97_30250 [Planctomycetota bacterium]|nr:hypothetical protein [Planctomycetota bacterium]